MKEDYGVIMNGTPRLLAWSYTAEELETLNALLKDLGAPLAVEIAANQGNLSLREIIHTGSSCGTELVFEEKVILFYNIPQQGIFFLIDAFKKTRLPSPIYAVVTEHSIEWPFSKLVEHLVEERRSMAKKGKP